MNGFLSGSPHRKRHTFFARVAGYAIFGVVPHGGLCEHPPDRLLRLEPGRAVFLDPSYERLCEKKLFVTRGDVARYFFVPIFKYPETVASVYRAPGRAGGLRGGFWLTVTRPTRRIAHLFDRRDAEMSDARTIKVERRDAPMPESTANATHRVWMTMLQQAGPRTRLDLEGDSDAMLFYATNHAGKILRGERFGTGDNV